MSETWKSINDYEGLYEISDLGNVKNSSGKQLKPFKNTRNYYQIGLTKEGKVKNFYVHRLVATAFLGEIYDQVDHIDSNKNNNALSNLRLCTKRENQLFHHKKKYPGTYYCARSKRWRSCIEISGKTKWLGSFKSPEEAVNKYLEEKTRAEQITRPLKEQQS